MKLPTNYPRSKKGTYWKQNKTLYGLLTCLAHHWHTKISNHLKDDMEFKEMQQDNCIFKCNPFAIEPPIYIVLYNLKSHVKVEFMGNVQWFLGQCYVWYTDTKNRVACHISQQALV